MVEKAASQTAAPSCEMRDILMIQVLMDLALALASLMPRGSGNSLLSSWAKTQAALVKP